MLSRELPDGLADRRATHPRPLHELALYEALARLQPHVDDGPADQVGRLLAHRRSARPVELRHLHGFSVHETV